MAKDLGALCKEILKKAHRIELETEGKKQIFYFVTPDDALYKKISKLRVNEIKELMKISDISLSYVDIKNNFTTQYSENGAAGGRYTTLPPEQRTCIEEILGIRKKSNSYG